MITMESMDLLLDFITNLTGTEVHVYSPPVLTSGYIYFVVPAEYVPEIKAYVELMIGSSPSYAYAIIPSDHCFLRMNRMDTYISVVKSFNRTIKSGSLS